MDDFGAKGLTHGIKAENDPDDLSPVCPLRLGIQQPQIGNQMSFIIGIYAVRQGRAILEGRGVHFWPLANLTGEFGSNQRILWQGSLGFHGIP
jgi:hypothetical protein